MILQMAKRVARGVIHRAKRPAGVLAMRHGQISSLKPLSTKFGFDRGKPIDRLYIESFLASHADDVRGHVLEATDDAYSRRFGAGSITAQSILHRNRGNKRATLVGDLADPETLPPGTFDCIILTQTLQYVFDLKAAVANIRRALKPGGVALITVPAIAPARPTAWADEHYWSFTEASLARMLATGFEPDRMEVTSFGNLCAATAFLHGAAVEDLDRSKLDPVQNEYAVIIAARAVA